MFERLTKVTGVAVVFMLFSWSLPAAEIYVAPDGDDANSGTREFPLQTLAAARDAVRPLAGKEPISVHVADGVYYLPETLVFTSADSGTEDHPVTYVAEHEGRAALSGGTNVALAWQPYRDGVFQAAAPPGLEIDQLFVDGVCQRMARYPNYDATKTTDAYQGYAADAFSRERAARWADPAGGYIHAMHRSRWGGYHYRITGKRPNGEVSYEGGWQNNRQMGMHKDYRMVENIFEELDAAGEWFHNAETQTLYYQPKPDVDLANATVEVVRLRHLVEFQGSEQSPVRFITFRGFVIRHAARTFMDTKEPLLRSDWAIYRGGAFMLTGTEDVSILDCEFDQVGGNAIFVNKYNRRTLVRGCHIHDVGASGVCFVGDPGAVRNPLFEYREKNDLSAIDRTPGPKTNNYPAEGSVEDCLIHSIGRVERQPAGVQIAMAMEISVRDTSIYDCARAGINIGDGCWGGHLIERCDVFDTVLETHDHGSFNSWGRDRYWSSDRSESQEEVDADPNLPLLDAMKTTIIRDSRWRCDHGWDIDLDDGSSNYEIYNNLLLSGGLKFREGFRRKAWNNIMVNNGFHPHVWYANSGDEFYSNIVMSAVKGIRAPTKTATGKHIDGNLFFISNSKQKDKYAEYGWDLNSIVNDPMFLDPAGGDFRVAPGSPALKIGFENFPMDRFGVKKRSLKAIAKTPIIPDLDSGNGGVVTSAAQSFAGDAFWLGVKLHELGGEGFSAYGTRKEDGGVALLDVPSTSEAARCGFEENDLIQAINGHQVTNRAQLFAALAKVGQAPLKVSLIRRQQAKTLHTAPRFYMVVEATDTAAGFVKLSIPNASLHKVTANQDTVNEPLDVLVDGQLDEDYGPVFRNGVRNGIYKMDLGQSKCVTAVSSWSFNQNGNRGAQKLTIYGSKSATDPGWNLHDRDRFVPVGSVDTSGTTSGLFIAASVRARQEQAIGEFRWIVWSVTPVTQLDENTAFQELAIEVAE
jgi:hypothetical protein